jgi:hypothetical protein
MLLVAAVALCYWNSLGAPFLFDDAGAIVNNPTIRHLGSLAVLNPPADGSTTSNRPVVNLSFAINYAISGERVWSYHALNVAIHALAALALLGIVRRTLAGWDRSMTVGRGLSPTGRVSSGVKPDLPALMIAAGRSGAASRAVGAGSGSATPSRASALGDGRSKPAP